jgi:hypothetical protein
MKRTEINTPCGKVRVGSTIRIDNVDAKTDMFPSGIDKQALNLEGKTGKVTGIDDSGTLWGDWGSLGVVSKADTFSVIEY